ncbi:MAG: hypothetical protein ACLTSZ_17750 [Lachnospiraceae bacterium]
MLRDILHHRQKIVKRLHRGKKLPEQCAIESGELIRAKGSRVMSTPSSVAFVTATESCSPVMVDCSSDMRESSDAAV